MCLVHSIPAGDKLLSRKLVMKWNNVCKDVHGKSFQVTKHKKACSEHFTNGAYHAGKSRRAKEKKVSSKWRRNLKKNHVFLTVFVWS